MLNGKVRRVAARSNDAGRTGAGGHVPFCPGGQPANHAVCAYFRNQAE